MTSLPLFLTKDNDGLTINAVGNYSGTPARFILKPTTENLFVNHLVIQIDAPDMFLDTYGSLPELGNGVEIRIEQENTPGIYTPVKTLLGGVAFTKTIDYSKVGGVIVPLQQGAATVGAQITLHLFEEATLYKDLNHVLTAYLSDSFLGLINQTFFAVGSEKCLSV